VHLLVHLKVFVHLINERNMEDIKLWQTGFEFTLSRWRCCSIGALYAPVTLSFFVGRISMACGNLRLLLYGHLIYRDTAMARCVAPSVTARGW